MYIAFDIHGTIDKNPEFFKTFMKALKNTNAFVSIISGPPQCEIEKELKDLGFKRLEHYISIYSIVDFLRETDVKLEQDEKGRWWCSEEEWWSSKGKICETYGIDILIDNEIKYKKYMPHDTTFVHWNHIG